MFTLRLLKIKIHSRRVSVFKRLLPVFAFLLASVMIAWPSLNEHKESFASTSLQNPLKKNNTDMKTVRFISKDNNQNPFSITADSVQETEPSRKIVSLHQPTARYIMANGVVLTGVTTYGLAFQNEKYLYFEESVNAKTDTGYQAISEKVVCDYNAGSIGSEQDVFIKGPAGMLKSNGVFLNEKGDYIHFKGHTATLLFNQEKAPDKIDTLDFEKQKSYLTEDKKNIFITSENGLTIRQQNQTITAFKNVDVYEEDNHLEAQKLTLNYLKKDQGKTEIIKITAEDDVKMTTQKNNATAKKMVVYRSSDEIKSLLKNLPNQQELKINFIPAQLIVFEDKATLKDGNNSLQADKIYAFYDGTATHLVKAIAYGKMCASNGTQRIYGNYGVYTPETKIVNIYEKVSLHEEKSVLKGEYATLNLNTGISSLSSPKNKKSISGRVKGQIIPQDFEKKQNK